MPLTKKGKKIMRAMQENTKEKAKQVFYASRNLGKFKGVERKTRKGMS